MIADIEMNGSSYRFDLNRPIDISLPLTSDPKAASAWYVPPVFIEPVRSDQFVGDVNEGGSVNFNNITFNPHGNGTHTEGVGHISAKKESVNQSLKRFFFSARLVSVEPKQMGEDRIIFREQLEGLLPEPCEAIIIRTLPNSADKKTRQYSNTNPPYLNADVVPLLNELGVKHLLLDLPSVDREVDNGVLAVHHAFWSYPESPDLERTITEFILVPDQVADGFYLLNLQMASFENDASPSKPVLYKPMESK